MEPTSAPPKSKPKATEADLDQDLGIADYEPVTARVITRNPTLWYAQIGISLGKDDGIRLDMPVVATDVGFVADVVADGSSGRLVRVGDIGDNHGHPRHGELEGHGSADREGGVGGIEERMAGRASDDLDLDRCGHLIRTTEKPAPRSRCR